MARYGDVSDSALTRHAQPPECSVDGCTRKPIAQTFCGAHYDRWRDHGDPLHGGEIRTHVAGDDRRRFWSKVDIAGPDDCWEWTGPRIPKGYGYIAIGGRKGKKVYAHRLSFEFANGETPPVVRHSCDNPPCVNPAHLLGGTVRDNIADKVSRGRQPRGESLGTAKLTAAQVLEIRRLIAAGISDGRISKSYGVCRASISNIRTGKAWAHLI